MEIYFNYNGYGIRYTTFRGTTHVESFGSIIKSFVGHGELTGSDLAKAYIDDLNSQQVH